MKNPPWPIELKWPIIVDEIVESIVTKNIHQPIGFSDLDIDVMNTISEEKDRRVEIISRFLGTEVPNSSDDWLELLDAVCRHWSIPAFRIERTKPRGPGGARKIWNDQKHCELFADVMSLSKGTLSEFGACKRIAQKPEQFGQRYLPRRRTKPERWAKTLHRQFITAKKKIQSDQLFRTVHFSLSSRPALDYWPELKNQAIKQYAYKRNSSQPKSA